MFDAIIVFSRKGILKKKVLAKEIRSNEHARKLWPLLAGDGSSYLVTWVKPSFTKDGKLSRKSHFRVLSTSRNLTKIINSEESQRQTFINESEEHKLAKKLIMEELQSRIDHGIGLQWWYKDKDISDFPLTGNLLLGAEKVEKEYILKTAFEINFRLDLVILGKVIHKEPIVLGGVEIEMSHSFDGRKALLCKSLGFPLISVDISDMDISEITPDWAKTILSLTAYDSSDTLRKNYFYIHDLLYPLFAQIPIYVNTKQKHQYLIFASHQNLKKIEDWIRFLASRLGYDTVDISIAIVNGNKSNQALTTVRNAGEIVGNGWEQFNNNMFLRITLPCAKNILDEKAYYLYMTIARILLSNVETLVGYQYKNGADRDDIVDDLWTAHVKPTGKTEFSTFKVLPKRLADPTSNYIQFLEQLK